MDGYEYWYFYILKCLHSIFPSHRRKIEYKYCQKHLQLKLVEGGKDMILYRRTGYTGKSVSRLRFLVAVHRAWSCLSLQRCWIGANVVGTSTLVSVNWRISMHGGRPRSKTTVPVQVTWYILSHLNTRCVNFTDCLCYFSLAYYHLICVLTPQ